MTKFKILLLNLGYCTGISGSLKEYIVNSYRYFYLPKEIEKKVLNQLKDIIRNEKPDLICLLEITKSQIEELVSQEYPFFNIETKYGRRSIMGRLSNIYKQAGNGFLSNQNIKYAKYLICGRTKRLVYELNLPNNIKLILFHFSLDKHTRKKQFKMIAKAIHKEKNKIICGDFNIDKGFTEILPLVKKLDVRLVSPRPTFPSHNPKRCYDFFLCSSNIETNSRVLKDNKISDHLPVILEIEVKNWIMSKFKKAIKNILGFKERNNNLNQ